MSVYLGERVEQYTGSVQWTKLRMITDFFHFHIHGKQQQNSAIVKAHLQTTSYNPKISFKPTENILQNN